MARSLDEQVKARNERKAEREKRAKAKRDAGLSHTNKPFLPVMTRSEQTRRLHELKAEMLSNNKVSLFVKKLFDVAMDDDHQGQTAAMKLIADRLLPSQGFSLDDKKSTGVQINITGLQVEKVEEKEVSPPVSIQ